MAFLPFAGRFLLPSDQHINMALEWLWWRWGRQDNLLLSMGLLDKKS